MPQFNLADLNEIIQRAENIFGKRKAKKVAQLKLLKELRDAVEKEIDSTLTDPLDKRELLPIHTVLSEVSINKLFLIINNDLLLPKKVHKSYLDLIKELKNRIKDQNVDAFKRDQLSVENQEQPLMIQDVMIAIRRNLKTREDKTNIAVLCRQTSIWFPPPKPLIYDKFTTEKIPNTENQRNKCSGLSPNGELLAVLKITSTLKSVAIALTDEPNNAARNNVNHADNDGAVENTVEGHVEAHLVIYNLHAKTHTRFDVEVGDYIGLTFSNNNKWLIAANREDGKAIIWDVETGEKKHTIPEMTKGNDERNRFIFALNEEEFIFARNHTEGMPFSLVSIHAPTGTFTKEYFTNYMFRSLHLLKNGNFVGLTKDPSPHPFNTNPTLGLVFTTKGEEVHCLSKGMLASDLMPEFISPMVGLFVNDTQFLICMGSKARIINVNEGTYTNYQINLDIDTERNTVARAAKDVCILEEGYIAVLTYHLSNVAVSSVGARRMSPLSEMVMEKQLNPYAEMLIIYDKAGKPVHVENVKNSIGMHFNYKNNREFIVITGDEIRLITFDQEKAFKNNQIPKVLPEYPGANKSPYISF